MESAAMTEVFKRLGERNVPFHLEERQFQKPTHEELFKLWPQEQQQ